MANREDSDVDDDFSDLYKEYTGPPRIGVADTTAKANKRSHAGSDEEEGTRDPNAVPTDFTSREAKVWEAKSKATERNWKKRKEEEMICKICGESGHFTQGCPSTLGANRKSQDFFERVPARDPQVRALFTEKVISKIEKEIGCKIKMEEKFMIVSGKDRLILAKGVDAVHKIKNETTASARSRSPVEGRSPPVSSRLGRSSNPNPNPNPSPRQRFSSSSSSSSRQERMIEERVPRDKLPRGSPQAYGSDGRRSTHSKSPGALQRSKTLEDLHFEYKRDAMEITRIRDKEEDEENNRHRKAVREMREDYMKRFGMVRAMHAKQWEEFLRQQQQQQHMPPPSAYGGYKQDGYHPDYDEKAAAAAYGGGGGGGNMGMDLRVRYPTDVDNYPPPPSSDSYGGEFQRQRPQSHHPYMNRY